MLSLTSTRLLAALALAASVLASAPSDEPEDELKAAVVLSFLRYSEWRPPLPGNAVLTVGVVGRTPFTEVLRRSLEGKSVNDHPVRVVELKNAADQAACQVVYFVQGKDTETRSELQSPALARALTMGESRDFLDSGGAVNLFVLDGHMAFEVSMEALERCGVTISSRLLRFGQIRNGKKGERP